MDLIEREDVFLTLENRFDEVGRGEGHCILLCGEAGIGKTALINAFCRDHKNDCQVLQGTCDPLFSPRPLAPFYDIAMQLGNEFWTGIKTINHRSGLFLHFFNQLSGNTGLSLIIFEDIHWADDATLDFIRFLGRRVKLLNCLLILSYRDSEIHSSHALRTVLGQLPVNTFTKIQLSPLSQTAVSRLAADKGYQGEDIYSITAGNPFYIIELLNNYNSGIPDNIVDSILAVFKARPEPIRRLWEILSIFPAGFEAAYIGLMIPSVQQHLSNPANSNMLIFNEGRLLFKHELNRRAIESSLSPIVRNALNEQILELFLSDFMDKQEPERIVHHAKNAGRFDLVLQFTQMAAKKMALAGSHSEAAELFLYVIRNYNGSDPDVLISYYGGYAYECYLSSQIKEAITYEEKLAGIWQEKNNAERTGDCMRFLSQLWWLAGKRSKAEEYAYKAVGIFENETASCAKLRALNNISQLKVSTGLPEECQLWGDQAIAMAKQLEDPELLSDALNTLGSADMYRPSSLGRGIVLLQESLTVALTGGFREQAARTYASLACNSLDCKVFSIASKILEEGISYCGQSGLQPWAFCMKASQARLYLETGNWQLAYNIACELITDENEAAVYVISALTTIAIIKMRKGDPGALELLIRAKEMAYETEEMQRIVPVFSALLEYEWISGRLVLQQFDIEFLTDEATAKVKVWQKKEFDFWVYKARAIRGDRNTAFEEYEWHDQSSSQKQAEICREHACDYLQALFLYEGSEADKKQALGIVRNLGAAAVCEKLKREMRKLGIRNIPRGIRQTTQQNFANLTSREIDVLVLLKDGLQNKEIADSLFISVKTVDHHISSILLKLDVRTRARAAQKAGALELSRSSF